MFPSTAPSFSLGREYLAPLLGGRELVYHPLHILALLDTHVLFAPRRPHHLGLVGVFAHVQYVHLGGFLSLDHLLTLF